MYEKVKQQFIDICYYTILQNWLIIAGVRMCKQNFNAVLMLFISYNKVNKVLRNTNVVSDSLS